MLNSISIMGRLTADPELKSTKSGTEVVSFCIATEKRKGEEKATDFFSVIAWRSTALFISKYFKKGQMIAISGRLGTSSYTDAKGEKRQKVEIVADNVYFCGSKEKSDNESKSIDIVEFEDDLPF